MSENIIRKILVNYTRIRRRKQVIIFSVFIKKMGKLMKKLFLIKLSQQ